MNTALLDIIASKPDYTISGEDRKIVYDFAEYMDHNSLFLLRFEPGSNPLFIFTNEAQRYAFSLLDIKEHYRKLKSGIPMDWENIPFEYISK